jgi:hypothetical protein
LISLSSKGRKHTEETKLKIKTALNKVNLGKKITIKTRAKLSDYAQGVNVKLFDRINKTTQIFTSMNKAANYLNISPGTISKILLRGKNFDDNFVFEFSIKDLRILIYDSNYKLINIVKNARTAALYYNIPRSTLVDYIKSGKIYKNNYYFQKIK